MATTIKEEIIRLADEGKQLTSQSVATALDADRKDVANALAALARDGVLERVTRGVYRTVTKSEPVEEPQAVEAEFVLPSPVLSGSQIEDLQRAAWIATLFDLDMDDLVLALAFYDTFRAQLSVED